MAARRGVAPLAGDELGNASGDELPLPAATDDQPVDHRDKEHRSLRAKSGFFLLGVLRPTARLAMMPDTGELGAALLSRRREGVPDAEGVVARKSGCCGGAFCIDCSSCMSASGGSELGNRSGDDIADDEREKGASA